jgi:hypothetical protein
MKFVLLKFVDALQILLESGTNDISAFRASLAQYVPEPTELRIKVLDKHETRI